MENYMIYIWAAAIVIFGVMEAATAQLVSVWFVVGSAAGFISTIAGAPIYLQITVFVVVSALALFITRPLVLKYISPKRQRTNADRVIGQIGIVVSEIDNIKATGDVRADGKLWSARSKDGAIIPPDTKVKITEISGVKLIVEQLD